jgi:hypothetical protein
VDTILPLTPITAIVAVIILDHHPINIIYHNPELILVESSDLVGYHRHRITLSCSNNILFHHLITSVLLPVPVVVVVVILIIIQ